MKEPIWHDTQRWQYKDLPDSLRVWLFDNASLTQRLRSSCDQTLRVEILNQTWARPFTAESKYLQLPLGQYAKIRQVYLRCQYQPWIFARTVIPQSTLSKIRYSFTRLKERPLGEGLFDAHTLRRNQTQIARIYPRHTLYQLATKGLNIQPFSLWGRRSLLYLPQKPILITEVFLPSISIY